MKNIRLLEIIPPDKTAFYTRLTRYSVLLGNDVRKLFKSMRSAKQYLAETNRFLNFKLHETNYLYAWIYAEYRRNWFYFTAETPVQAAELRNQERDILVYLKQIDQAMDHMVKNSHRSNGNYFVFKNFFLVLDNLAGIIDQLQEIQKNRKYYAEYQRLEIFKNHSIRIREQLVNYGRDPKDQKKFKENTPIEVFPPGWNEVYSPQ